MSNYKPLTLTVKFNADNVDNLVHRIRNLQTYKLFENDDMLLVDLEEVCDIFMDYLDYEKLNHNKWIHVKDGLPRDTKQKIVFHSRGVSFAYYSNGTWYSSIGKSHIVRTVTHWMDMPEPPYKEGVLNG